MFKLYALNIANNKSCTAQKRLQDFFFIILELIRIYQPLPPLKNTFFQKAYHPQDGAFFVYPWSRQS